MRPIAAITSALLFFLGIGVAEAADATKRKQPASF
jgi:hypothetical protein